MIKIDWTSYFQNRIWFGHYWLPGLPNNPNSPGVGWRGESIGYWYRAQGLSCWAFKKRSFEWMT